MDKFNLEVLYGETKKCATEYWSQYFTLTLNNKDKLFIGGSTTVGMIDGIRRFGVKEFSFKELKSYRNFNEWRPDFSETFCLDTGSGLDFFESIYEVLKEGREDIKVKEKEQLNKIIDFMERWLKENHHIVKDTDLFIALQKENEKLSIELHDLRMKRSLRHKVGRFLGL